MKILTILFALIIISGTAWAGEFIVIVNSGVGATLSTADVSNHYLNKDDSLRAFDLKGKSSARTSFLNDVVGKKPKNYKRFWANLRGKGDGRNYPKRKSGTDLLAAVAETPNSIGFLPSNMKGDAQSNGSVKILKIK